MLVHVQENLTLHGGVGILDVTSPPTLHLTFPTLRLVLQMGKCPANSAHLVALAYKAQQHAVASISV